MVDHREVNNFRDFFCHYRELNQSERHRRYTLEPGQRFRCWYDFARFDFHPIESVSEDKVDCASRIDKNSCDLEIPDYELNKERIAMVLVDSASLFLLAGDRFVRYIAGWRRGGPVCVFFQLFTGRP